jgi:hypothetical protein
MRPLMVLFIHCSFICSEVKPDPLQHRFWIPDQARICAVRNEDRA